VKALLVFVRGIVIAAEKRGGKMSTFDGISDKYKEKSLVQQQAASKLIKLLDIRDTDSIVDVACGPGNLTNSFLSFTGGRIVGTDISGGMIEKAREKYPGLEFRQVATEDLAYDDEFDVVFCNSALQWFVDPDKAMQAMFRALKSPGKIGLACPATSKWTPWLDRIISRVASYEEIKSIFSQWKNPWFHLPGESDYKVFFEKHGFKTAFIKVEHEETIYSIDDAFNIYLSGAANGFVSKKYYPVEITDEYVAKFNNYVRIEIENDSEGGKTKVEFNRLYYIGEKHI
jgi:ubiquinone/menaquinone biosynthesis C-methylase UbiE